MDFPQGILKVCKIFVLEKFNFYLYQQTQYNNLNIKLTNSKPKKNSAIKNATEVVSRLSSYMICDCNDGSNVPHKLSLSNRQAFVKLL